jgi:guanylate kinase
MRRGILFCIVGPAGSGKTSVSEELLRDAQLGVKASLSVTARAPRANEVDGEHYHFVSVEEFQRRAKAKLFFEYEEVHGNWYGTPLKNLDDAILKGEDLLLRIDINGALRAKRKLPQDVVVIFLVAPSAAELERRIQARGSVSAEERARRLVTAKHEYARLQGNDRKAIDYIVVNEHFKVTVEQVRAIIEAERHRALRYQSAALAELCSMES